MIIIEQLAAQHKFNKGKHKKEKKMITGNMLIMFISRIYNILFLFIAGLLYAIYWGHNSQKQDMLNDPELRNYYARHNMPDNLDYDGHWKLW